MKFFARAERTNTHRVAPENRVPIPSVRPDVVTPASQRVRDCSWLPEEEWVVPEEEWVDSSFTSKDAR